MTDILGERAKTHGDWRETSEVAQRLVAAVSSHGQMRLSPQQREAVEMILRKVARIVCGDPAHPDHWDDIIGYARLGKGECAS